MRKLYEDTAVVEEPVSKSFSQESERNNQEDETEKGCRAL